MHDPRPSEVIRFRAARAYRDKDDGRWRSEGRRLLLALLREVNNDKAVAITLGVEIKTLNGWKTGRRSPESFDGAVLEFAYRVPASAWAVAPRDDEASAERGPRGADTPE